MVMESKLVAETRRERGTAAVRRIRRDGWLPCVIYGLEGETRSIKTETHAFEMLLQHHRSESMMVDVEIDGGDARKVLLKEVQHDPVTDRPLHADFVEVSMTEKMTVEVPLMLVGECLGVSLDGGVLDHTLRELEVECLPADLKESIDVDVTNLRIGHTLLVRDLALPEGMTAVSEGDLAVASVHAQRVAEEEVAAVEGEAPAAGEEPEVIGKKKEEEAGEDAKEE